MDEEQQIILRMLKEGKISVEEADALLRALAEQRGAEEEEAEVPDVAEVPEVPRVPRAPKAEIAGLREEIQGIIADILKTVPKEVIRGMKIGVQGARRHGFFNLVQGLRGLEEGRAELTVTEAMNSGDTLEVRNAWGDVQVQPSSGNAMELNAQVRVWGPTAAEAQRVASSLSIEARRHGTMVIVTVPRLEGWRVRADLKIAVPAGVNMTLAEAKGDVQAQGLTGSLRVGVASGDVDVSDHRGPVDIEVKSGDLTLRQINGDTHVDVKSGDVNVAQARGALRGRVVSGNVEAVETGEVSLDMINGDLSVTAVAGNVNVETKSGDIDLRRLRSQAVHVRAISGDVAVEFEEFANGEIEVETVSGDIEVALPAGAHATIDASVRSGEVECTLPLQDARRDRRTLHGVLNAPDGKVTLRALSGDIEIRERRG